MRWRLLDEIISIEKSRKAVTRSHVLAGEFSPEILLIEMMAQTGALLLGAESNFQKDLIFAKIDTAGFMPPYQAGEPVWIESTSENLRPEGAWLDGVIRNREREIASSRVLLMPMDPLIPGHQEPVTFHQNFMEHYCVRDKVL